MNELDRAALSMYRFGQVYRDAKRYSRRRVLKRLITRTSLIWATVFALCWGLTPLMFQLADMERGYDSTGGEALIPMIPVIALILTVTNRISK